MTDIISPGIRANIAALVCDLAAEHRLDGDAREVLEKKIEQSFIGYLQGTGTLTEEEAFLLVREHFGNPEVIRELYYENGRRFSLPMLARWAGAAFAVYAGVSAADRLLYDVQERLFIASGSASGLSGSLSRNTVNFLMMAPSMFFYLAGLLFMYWIFRRWRRDEEQGRTLWYHRLGIWQIVAIALALFSLSVFFDTVFPVRRFDIDQYFSFSENTYVPNLVYLNIIFSFIVMYLHMGRNVLMLWWFDRKPRLLNLPAGLLAICLYSVIDFPLRNILYVVYGEWPLRMLRWNMRLSLPDSRILPELMVYLAIAGYIALRRRVITVMKPAGAFHD